MKLCFFILFSGLFSLQLISQEGCTDSNASNFDVSATLDDGSCCYENYLTVEMTDSYGDGGVSFSLFEEGTGNLLLSGFLDDGFSEVIHGCVPNGCHDLIVTGDFYPDEIGLVFSNSDGAILYTEFEGGGINETALLTINGCIEPQVEGSGTCTDPYIVESLGFNSFSATIEEPVYIIADENSYLTIISDSNIQVSMYHSATDPCTNLGDFVYCGNRFIKFGRITKIEPLADGPVAVSASGCPASWCDPGYCGDENACNYTHFSGGIAAVPEYCSYDCCTDENALNYLESCYDLNECIYETVHLGDYNEDGVYTSFDLSFFLGEFGTIGNGLLGDFNQDGSVSAGDLAHFLSLFGTSYED